MRIQQNVRRQVVLRELGVFQLTDLVIANLGGVKRAYNLPPLEWGCP